MTGREFRTISTPVPTPISSTRISTPTPTPTLVLDRDALDRNLQRMAEVLPGRRLRPHVKAHKCSALAARQASLGHLGFCCATAREVIGMARAGLGDDLLLANELVDVRRLTHLAALDARVTLAVDSPETIDAAAAAGLREVLIDIDVGLPRCGCTPEQAGPLATRARSRGLEVRGVMGYEGQIMGVAEREKREPACQESMRILLAAHSQVGGEVISAGGTGTYDCNRWASEIQAGSYALMDTAYARLGLPFEQAFWVEATVISVASAYAVADCGLKALGMDHGNPAVDAADIWFCSDEHVTFAPQAPLRVGDHIRVIPAHVDPTVAYHERFVVVSGDRIVDEWPVDLRGW